jgi:hypothetical protein
MFAMFLLILALASAFTRPAEPAARNGDIGSYFVFERINGDFFGDGQEVLIELVYVEGGDWPDYFWRVTPQGAREPRYYPLSLYTSVGGLKPLLTINDIDGDGIPEIFVEYHAGGTGGLEFSLYSFRDGEPRELASTDGDNIEYPDIDFELMKGFRIKTKYAGRERIYKIGDFSWADYFFKSDGIPNEEEEPFFYEIFLTEKFSDFEFVDIDGDGICEIKGSVIIGGAASNASYFGNVDVVYIWKDDRLRIREVSHIRFSD